MRSPTKWATTSAEPARHLHQGAPAATGLSQVAQNRLSVSFELQADCFAGVWGHHGKEQVLERGDLEEALNAAQAIGDDRLQQQGQGRVVPDKLHPRHLGPALAWFKRGFDSGKARQLRHLRRPLDVQKKGRNLTGSGPFCHAWEPQYRRLTITSLPCASQRQGK